SFVLLHPHDCIVVPLPRLLFVTQAPMSHGQEKPVRTVTALAKLRRLRQGLKGALPILRAITGGAERIPVVSLVGGQFDGFLGQINRPPRVPQLWVRAGG